MTRLRGTLAPIVAIWLSCQIGTTVLVPLALWVSTAERHEVECLCGHGAGVICPMHRHNPVRDPNRCSMYATNQAGTATLTTIVGTTGLIPESVVALAAPRASVNFMATAAGLRVERSVPPDPPPPRA